MIELLKISNSKKLEDKRIKEYLTKHQNGVMKWKLKVEIKDHLKDGSFKMIEVGSKKEVSEIIKSNSSEKNPPIFQSPNTSSTTLVTDIFAHSPRTSLIKEKESDFLRK